MRNNQRVINGVLFAFIACILLVTYSRMSPKVYGDGPEYVATTDYLFELFRLDIRNTEKQHPDTLRAQLSYTCKQMGGYVNPADGLGYCYHSPIYSLTTLPVKFALHLFHFDEMKAFQLTNALLVMLALYHILFVADLAQRQKIFFSLLYLCGPILWFIHWTHPEMFSSTLVVIALAYMTRQRYPAAILCVALASVQNQPLIFLAAFLWIKGMIESDKRIKDFFVLSLFSFPMFIPPVTNYIMFGTHSLLAKNATSVHNITALKVWELFADLNMGMLPYWPVMIGLFFILIVTDVFLRRKFTLSVQLFIVLLIMGTLCTLTNNWNHGSSGPSRYSTWMIPIVIFAVVAHPWLADRKKWMVSLLSLAVLLQLGLLYKWGGLTTWLNSNDHTTAAKLVLNRLPSVYNPSHEIFIERTLHQDYKGEDIATPVIYSHQGRCKKALAKPSDQSKLTQSCRTIPQKYLVQFKENNPNEYFYVNY